MEFIKEYTVSELVKSLQTTIEQNFYYVKINGEVSACKVSSAGHIYLNLKDENALINAIIFKNVPMRFKIEDGLKIKAFGRLTIYKERSNYQIIIEALELDGEGNLLRLFNEKKKKLEELGIFDEKYKKPIPENPKRIGIITSLTGAGIRDIESRLHNKLLPEIIVYDSLVQGKDAEKTIIAGIEYFNKHKVDFIIITRGGGSMEDLICFNSENIVMAIFNSQIPIITAVGHEIDWTLVDYVADLRLPTPTSVAEYIGKSKKELWEKVVYLMNNIFSVIIGNIEDKNDRLENLIDRIFLNLKFKYKHIFEKYYDFVNDVYNKIIDKILYNYKNCIYKINMIDAKLKKFDLSFIFKKGFAVVKNDKGIVKENDDVKENDILYICFKNKKIKVKVLNKNIDIVI